MNANDANELNKWIENSPYTEQEEVIVLLRQQQDEIKALKERLEFWVKIADKERLRADRNEQ